MLLSVIMPCYNAEKTMRSAIESILNQSFGDFELLLVDDGSGDNTPLICDEFVLKDSRVKVFHTRNHGVGHARNMGLEVCKGDFVGFADADDFLHPQMFEILLSAAEKSDADIVMCDYEKVENLFNPLKDMQMYDKGSIEFTSLDHENIYKSLFGMPEESIPLSVVWNKIYRREAALTGHFLENGSEDAGYNCMVYGKAEKIVKIDSVLYFWNQIETSITHQHDPLRSYYVLESYFEMANIVEEQHPRYNKYAFVKLYRRVLGTRYEKNRESSKMMKNLLKKQFAPFEKKFLRCEEIPSKTKAALCTLYRCPHLYTCAKKINKKMRNQG